MSAAARSPLPATGSLPLFTPRFFLMCAFSFTVFLSAFMLLPTAPFRILGLEIGRASCRERVYVLV